MDRGGVVGVKKRRLWCQIGWFVLTSFVVVIISGAVLTVKLGANEIAKEDRLIQTDFTNQVLGFATLWIYFFDEASDAFIVAQGMYSCPEPMSHFEHMTLAHYVQPGGDFQSVMEGDLMYAPLVRDVNRTAFQAATSTAFNASFSIMDVDVPSTGRRVRDSAAVYAPLVHDSVPDMVSHPLWGADLFKLATINDTMWSAYSSGKPAVSQPMCTSNSLVVGLNTSLCPSTANVSVFLVTPVMTLNAAGQVTTEIKGFVIGRMYIDAAANILISRLPSSHTSEVVYTNELYAIEDVNSSSLFAHETVDCSLTNNVAIHNEPFGQGNLLLTAFLHSLGVSELISARDEPVNSHRSVLFCVNNRRWNALVVVDPVTLEVYRVDKHTIVYRLGIILIAICAAVVLVIAVTVGFWIKRCYYNQFERFVKGQAALAAHEQALHFACHEIRNPLHAITASSHYLVEFFRRSLSQHEYMDQIELNMLKAELMTMKINIMLDAAKAKAGKLEVDQGLVTVPQLVDKTANMYKLLARVGIAWSVAPDLPGTIWSDGNKIRQILSFGFSASAARCQSVTNLIRLEVSSNADHSNIEFIVTDNAVDVTQASGELTRVPAAPTAARSVPARRGCCGMDTLDDDHEFAFGGDLVFAAELASKLGGRLTLYIQGDENVFHLVLPLSPVDMRGEDGFDEGTVGAVRHGICAPVLPLPGYDLSQRPPIPWRAVVEHEAMETAPSRQAGVRVSAPDADAPPAPTTTFVTPLHASRPSGGAVVIDVAASSAVAAVEPVVTSVVEVSASDAAAAPVAAAAAAPARKLRVLICDDEPVNIKTLTMPLKKLGCVVEATKVGEEVEPMLAAAGNFPGAPAAEGAPAPFDILFLDLHIGPTCDGTLICQQLIRRGASLPIVAYTSSPDGNLRDFGFVDVLLKGAGMDAIRSVLHRFRSGEYAARR